MILVGICGGEFRRPAAVRKELMETRDSLHMTTTVHEKVAEMLAPMVKRLWGV